MKTKKRELRAGGFELNLPPEARKLHLRFSPPWLDLGGGERRARLSLTLPELPAVGSVVLALDAYALDRPVHPQGHFGWWTFDLEAKQEASFSLALREGRLAVESRNAAARESWVNPAPAKGPKGEDILLHLVLRHSINNSILSQQSLVAYGGKAGLAAGRALAKSCAWAASGEPLLLSQGFNWPDAATVRLVTRTLPQPGKTAGLPQALLLARRMALAGVPARLYATDFDPRLRDPVCGTRELLDVVQPQDLLLLLHDDFEPNLCWLQRLACRKAFVHLGLPSSVRLQAFDAEAHRNYAQARKACAAARSFDLVAAPTRAAAQELAAALAAAPADDAPEQAAVEILNAPLVRRAELWQEITAGAAPQAGRPLLVCPTRLEPCNDFLATLALFEKIAEQSPGATLVAASTRAREVYFQYVTHLLATRFAPLRERVHLWTDIPDDALKALLQDCDGLIQMGPLGEEEVQDAAFFGKPLFASGQDPAAQSHGLGALRLFGAPQEQAAAILDVVSRPWRPVVPACAAQGDGLWPLLERLLRLPAPA